MGIKVGPMLGKVLTGLNLQINGEMYDIYVTAPISDIIKYTANIDLMTNTVADRTFVKDILIGIFKRKPPVLYGIDKVSVYVGTNGSATSEITLWEVV